MESRTFLWGFFSNTESLSWSYMLLSDDVLSSVQPLRTRSLFIFFFSLEGLGSQWMSETHHPRLPLWTPMDMTPCWSLYVTQKLAYSWRRYLMKKKHATKMRFIVLKVIPIGIIPDTQTRLSGGCSGIALFLSQRTC